MDLAMMKNLALGAIPPAIIAGACFLPMWWKRPAAASAKADAPARTDWRLVLTPLIMAFATIVTFSLVMGALPKYPPTRAMEWMPYIALAAGLAGAVAAMERLPAVFRWLPSFVVLLGAWWASSRRLIEGTWTPEQSAIELLEFVTPGLVLLAATMVMAGRRAGVSGIIVLLVLTGSVSQFLVIGYYSLVQGQIIGMTSSMLIAALGVALWRRGLRIGPGAVVFAGVMMTTVLYHGRLYGTAGAELSRGYALLVLFSAVLGSLVHAGIPEKLTRFRAVATVATVAIPLFIGLAYTGKNYLAEMESSEYVRAELP